MTRLDPFHLLHPEPQGRLPHVPAVVLGHHSMMLLLPGAGEDMVSGLSLEDIRRADNPHVLPGCIRILGDHLGEVRHMEAHSLAGLHKELAAVADDRTAIVTGAKESAFSPLQASQNHYPQAPQELRKRRTVEILLQKKYLPEDNILAAEALHIGLVHEEDSQAVQDNHRIPHQAAVRRTGDAAEVHRSSQTFLLELFVERKYDVQIVETLNRHRYNFFDENRSNAPGAKD